MKFKLNGFKDTEQVLSWVLPDTMTAYVNRAINVLPDGFNTFIESEVVDNIFFFMNVSIDTNNLTFFVNKH